MALCTPICPQRDTICRGGVGRGLTTIHLTSRQSRMRPQTRKRLIDSLFLFLMILPTYPMPLQSIFFTGQPIFLMAFKNINAIVCVNIVCDVIILRDRNKVATTGLGGNSAWSENFRMIWKVFRRSESSPILHIASQGLACLSSNYWILGLVHMCLIPYPFPHPFFI